MELTRRTFLKVAGSAAAAPLSHGQLAARAPRAVIVAQRVTRGIPESAAGYERALTILGLPVSRVTGLGPASPAGTAMLAVAPSVARVPRTLARQLADAAWQGSTVLLESAAAFLEGEAGAAARADLGESFGMLAGPPVKLWAAARGGERVPYVDFTWPVAVKVRDFSRVVPLSGPGWRVVARAEGLPVALARDVGRGTLVVLGSPLGPALAYGDREAHRWLAGLGRRC